MAAKDPPQRPTHIQDNTILNTDSYKLTHHRMYPPGTRYVGSYLESRAGGEYDHTVFFGLQYLLDRHLAGVRVTRSMIDEAEELCEWHLGGGIFNRAGWEHILDAHGGRLPVSIRAVPEGSVIPSSNVLLTIENTDPEVPWITNHIETLLVQLWYPCTVSTISLNLLRAIRAATARTGYANPPWLMLHDFGFRGSTGAEAAAIGGAAHLVHFQGTDNIAAMRLLMEHYGEPKPGFSVPAAEHSTIISWGRERELDAYRHIIRSYPEGTVSVVSDSYDVIRACREMWGGALKEEIGHGKGRRLVVRPDSGDPLGMMLKCLEALAERFGSRTNKRGYRVLPKNISLLQGDGITRHSLPGILSGLVEAGWSTDNVAFGSGGGLLQDCDRDTLRFALKCSWVDVDGEVRGVSKRPASDPAKGSKAGMLGLVRSGSSYRTTTDGSNDVLREVFRNGEILERCTLEDVRQRAGAE